jgi:hypothetical protein
MSSESQQHQKEKSAFSNVGWWLFRTTVGLTCLVILIAAVLLSSRYRSNVRLEGMVKPSNPFDVAFSYSPSPPVWLEQCIGANRALMMVARPTHLLVHGHVSKVSDSTILQLLKESSGLTGISVHSRNLPDKALAVIADRHPVEMLYFRCTAINAEDARKLSQMKKLRELYIEQFVYEPRENDWSFLTALPNLKKVALYLWDINDKDAIAIARCPQLWSLTLSGNSLTDAGLYTLCDSPKLEYLELSGPEIRLHFPDGRKLPSSLKGLELTFTAVDDQSLAALAESPQLERIWILGGAVTDAGVASLTRLPALKELWLEQLNDVTSNCLQSLKSNSKLTNVYLTQCGRTGAGFEFNDDVYTRESGTAKLVRTSDEVARSVAEQRARLQARLEEYQARARAAAMP